MSSAPPPADPATSNPAGPQAPAGPPPKPVKRLIYLAWVIAPWLFAAVGFYLAMVVVHNVGVGKASGLIVAAFVAFLCAMSVQKIHGLEVGRLVHLAYGACLVGFAVLVVVIVDEATGYGILKHIEAMVLGEVDAATDPLLKFTIWDGFECEWAMGPIHKVGVILKLNAMVVVAIGLGWFLFVVATTWNDPKASVFHKFWVGAGKWGLMGAASVIVGGWLMSQTISPEQCRAQIAAQVAAEADAEAKDEAEEAARKAEAAAQVEQSGSKPRKQKSSVKSHKDEPAPVYEDRPVLQTVASVAPSTNAGCTRRKVGVIAGGQAIYACIPN